MSQRRKLFEPAIVRSAAVESFRKLDPRHQARNPVMFVVFAGSILTSVLGVQALGGRGEAPAGFILTISAWLWFTVLFGNFAEAQRAHAPTPKNRLRWSRCQHEICCLFPLGCCATLWGWCTSGSGSGLPHSFSSSCLSHSLLDRPSRAGLRHDCRTEQ